MIGRSYRRPMSMNASMSHGFPAQWTTSMARVRSVIRLSASAASMFSVSASQSAKTGIAFWIRMPSTDPMSVAGAVMISSPGSGLTAPIAAWIAPVPESVEKAYLTPCISANRSSSLRIWPDLPQLSSAPSITSITASSSSSPITQV